MEQARLLCIFLLASVLAGCSSFSRYVVSNNSDDIVVVNYSHPAYFSGSEQHSICPLRPVGALPQTTLDKLSGDSVSWQRLGLDKFIFNDLECSIRVGIVAGASVTFATHDPHQEKMLAISSIDTRLIQLNMQNEKGNVVLKGVRKFKRFERNGEKWYVYNFP